MLETLNTLTKNTIRGAPMISQVKTLFRCPCCHAYLLQHKAISSRAIKALLFPTLIHLYLELSLHLYMPLPSCALVLMSPYAYIPDPSICLSVPLPTFCLTSQKSLFI